MPNLTDDHCSKQASKSSQRPVGTIRIVLIERKLQGYQRVTTPKQTLLQKGSSSFLCFVSCRDFFLQRKERRFKHFYLFSLQSPVFLARIRYAPPSNATIYSKLCCSKKTWKPSPLANNSSEFHQQVMC